MPSTTRSPWRRCWRRSAPSAPGSLSWPAPSEHTHAPWRGPRTVTPSGHVGGSADVEDAEAQGPADAGDDPEADHDRGLGPAGQLEMMLQRRHAEHALAGQLERA